MTRLDDILFDVDASDPHELTLALLRDREALLTEIEQLQERVRRNRHWAITWRYFAWSQREKVRIQRERAEHAEQRERETWERYRGASRD